MSSIRRLDPVGLWAGLGLLAGVALPWYFLQDTGLLQSLSQGPFSQAPTASALAQVLAHGRWWLGLPLLALLAALALALALALARSPRGRPARWPLQAGFFARTGSAAWVLTATATFGLLATLFSGFAIGIKGWNWGWLAAAGSALGPAATQGQPGFGWGAGVVLLSLAVLLGLGLARLGLFKGDGLVASAVVVSTGLLALFVGLPVLKAISGAFVDEVGNFSTAMLGQRLLHTRVWGLGCLGGGTNCGVAWNTLFLAIMTATSTTALGALIALWSERAAGPKTGKGLKLLALLPIITPPFVVGLGLILLFGRAGLVNQGLEWAFGITPSRWFYGWFGVWVAQTFAFTPIAYMILRGVVQGIAPSLEEASQTLRADRARTFRRVTLPLLKPGLANAFLVGFIESMADFGNPIVLGGSYAVLSTDIFFAIVGAQFDQGRAASLALLLTAFALAVFFLQRRLLRGAKYTTVSGKGDSGLPMPLPTGVRRAVAWVAGPWLGFTAVVYLFALIGGFVKTWGRDYTPTLAHFKGAFALEMGHHGLVWAGSAWNSLFTTVLLAAAAAPLCAVLGIGLSWLLARTSFKGQGALEFAALLAFAIPGTVLGVSYILAFNVPPFELTGTAIVIVLCFVFRNLPVGVRAGTAAFEQLDKSLDEASLMLRAGTATTLRRVVLPLVKPALVAALVYAFVRSMTTVSAVIFLVTAEYELATTFIIGRVQNGDYGVALAYCTVLIVLMSLATAAIQALVGERRLGRRNRHAATNTSAAAAR